MGLRLGARDVHHQHEVRAVPRGRQRPGPRQGLVDGAGVVLRGRHPVHDGAQPHDRHLREQLLGPGLHDGVRGAVPAGPLHVQPVDQHPCEHGRGGGRGSVDGVPRSRWLSLRQRSIPTETNDRPRGGGGGDLVCADLERRNLVRRKFGTNSEIPPNTGGGGGGNLVWEETCLEKFRTANSGAIFPITFNDCGGNSGGPQQKIPKRNCKKIKSKARGLLIGELRPGSAAGCNQYFGCHLQCGELRGPEQTRPSSQLFLKWCPPQ